MRTRWAAPKVAALLLSVFAVATAQAKAQESRVDLNLRLGAEAMHGGKAEEAEKYFRAVIQ